MTASVRRRCATMSEFVEQEHALASIDTSYFASDEELSAEQLKAAQVEQCWLEHDQAPF